MQGTRISCPWQAPPPHPPPPAARAPPPQVKVTTVDGPVELKIPPGTQPGTTLLMAKRGVPRLGSPSVRGDHMVHVRVKIPKQLAAEERKLVEELKELQSKTKVGAGRGAVQRGRGGGERVCVRGAKPGQGGIAKTSAGGGCWRWAGVLRDRGRV